MREFDGTSSSEHAARVTVVMETGVGSIEIDVYVQRAPISSYAFLALVEDGSFSKDGVFFRVVRRDENDQGQPQIDVIQAWLQESHAGLSGIKHEATSQTNLQHRNGTVSLARSRTEAATGAEFFICIGDQPGLDAGGSRIDDGLGFAAFGQVINGMDTVHHIHAQQTRYSSDDPYLKGQILDPPVRIVRAFRSVGDRADQLLAPHEGGCS